MLGDVYKRQPDMVAKAFAKDSVLFILGILALSVGIMNSKLDRRLGLLLLRTSTSLPRYLFFFLPLLAVCASFLSEYALVAIITPTLMLAYRAALDSSGIAKDRSLAVLLVLSMCFAANQGGPGSPAAGGHNAIMMGILADYGKAPSFSNWLTYGLPFVPVMALVIASYFAGSILIVPDGPATRHSGAIMPPASFASLSTMDCQKRVSRSPMTCGSLDMAEPPVDLKTERRTGRFSSPAGACRIWPLPFVMAERGVPR